MVKVDEGFIRSRQRGMDILVHSDLVLGSKIVLDCFGRLRKNKKVKRYYMLCVGSSLTYVLHEGEFGCVEIFQVPNLKPFHTDHTQSHAKML